tara:strand:+ start:1417 stop:2082 length:666 start_codon:yes stop_codon:yes gene_type:complete
MSTIIVGRPESGKNSQSITKIINYFEENNFEVISEKTKDIINKNLFINLQISGLLLIENRTNQIHSQNLSTIDFFKQVRKKNIPLLAFGTFLDSFNKACFENNSTDVQIQNKTMLEPESLKRTLYLSPGSKFSNLVGRGGFFPLFDIKFEQILESTKNKMLLGSGYCVELGTLVILENSANQCSIASGINFTESKHFLKTFENILKNFVIECNNYTKQIKM